MSVKIRLGACGPYLVAGGGGACAAHTSAFSSVLGFALGERKTKHAKKTLIGKEK
jgi:hypothetical protein